MFMTRPTRLPKHVTVTFRLEGQEVATSLYLD